ncbi:potassium/sodium hyperpolarization-activated cyclic nucleotide-gated channel 4 [Triticum aestivum]|uniref:potassium/sodium hyperpolarization-activated cyclic nucleotide-gated channel 4 n=1 Tax=Triticum aestivum TaxID=4565 RepID=UPI00098B5DCA|nr:potassium/sodium hyperpolarization-activated cyclic nucleotide-gated channel 4-like [Aegilops tauschii subsp. strangulata]XP_044356795.1 potassium/sodium hyperpolarization-activated cyclic nucleotide-gated channel 4-like [Triticum aestivum]
MLVLPVTPPRSPTSDPADWGEDRLLVCAPPTGVRTGASPPASPGLPATPTSFLSAMGSGVASVLSTPVVAPPHPPRTASYSRRGRSTSTPVTSSWRSARIVAARPAGNPALPIPERAELRAAARNLEPALAAA